MDGSNRKAFVLVATGDIAVVSGRWRAYGRDAFLTRQDAEAEIPAFLDRCRAAEEELLGPDAATLSVKVVALELADDLDAPDGEVHLITAEGRDTVLERILPFVCGTLHASRASAEAEMPAFLDRCSDPAFGERHSSREDLKGRIATLSLRESREATADRVFHGP